LAVACGRGDLFHDVSFEGCLAGAPVAGLKGAAAWSVTDQGRGSGGGGGGLNIGFMTLAEVGGGGQRRRGEAQRCSLDQIAVLASSVSNPRFDTEHIIQVCVSVVAGLLDLSSPSPPPLLLLPPLMPPPPLLQYDASTAFVRRCVCWGAPGAQVHRLGHRRGARHCRVCRRCHCDAALRLVHVFDLRVCGGA
jgi:hypothetical protein